MKKPFLSFLKGESMRSGNTIKLTNTAYKAFSRVRESLSKEILRTQPDFDREFVLTTDVSRSAIGGILSQVGPDGIERMVYTYSKTMDSAQINYGITDKELLAVIKSVEHFRMYLLGKEFLLKTNHKALTYIAQVKTPSSRLLR
ncbi:hypothetical protein PAEPH01_2018 [Pancytospora epiphaga]|nr:hypothetical protein PAEPH01_2018 [Pancytospora epiphaga]